MTSDVRELKRAVRVKLREGGMATEAGSEVLHVAPRAVRAWCQRDEREGVEGVRVQYRGSESYPRGEQRQEREDWLGAQETITVEEVRSLKRGRGASINPSRPLLIDWRSVG